jgi:hypothetical protein
VRLLNHHFLSVWKQLHSVGAKHRGLVSLMRPACSESDRQTAPQIDAYLERFSALKIVYQFKQRLCHLLLTKHRTVKHCRRLALKPLRASGFAALRTLGETFSSWADEIARMWRYTRNNGITEGFHTKIRGAAAPIVRLPQFPKLSLAG